MKDNEELEITILMPCLNEAETIEGCVREAIEAIREYGAAGEVLVADNGSDDGSDGIARKAGARVISVAEKGYGHALIAGIQAARGRFVLMGDADGSYDFGELPNFLKKLKSGYDLVMGCRLPKGGGTIEPNAMPWKHRWLGNPVLSGLGRLFFKAPVDDFHCGLRAFRRDAMISLGLKSGGMEFASEMVMKAQLGSLRICQIPVTLRPDKRSGSPHLRSWRDGWRHLRFMLLYSPDWLFVLPGVVLSFMGLAGFLILLPGPFTFRGVTFDLNSLLISSVTMILGYQTLAFALFVKIYAANSGLIPGKRPHLLEWIEGRPVEIGIMAGIVFMLVGIACLVANILAWKDVGFGRLPVQESLRMTIVTVTALTLGIQTIFSGFVIAILGLKR